MTISISVLALEAFKSPFENNPWGCGTVTKAMVKKAIAQGHSLDHQQWESTKAASRNKKPTRLQHAARIAYLMDAGWSDSMQIDIGIPSLGFMPEWPYEDGNHRLCAAIMRNDDTINVEFSGDIDFAVELFGSDVAAKLEAEAA
jgi:hypothetical protein